MMWGYGSGGEFTWWMALVDVLIGALVIAGIIAIVVFMARMGSHPYGEDARRILEERFARGEIDQEEFQRRSATLSSQTGQHARPEARPEA
jgi:putative membrane protein